MKDTLKTFKDLQKQSGGKGEQGKEEKDLKDQKDKNKDKFEGFSSLGNVLKKKLTTDDSGKGEEEVATAPPPSQPSTQPPPIPQGGTEAPPLNSIQSQPAHPPPVKSKTPPASTGSIFDSMKKPVKESVYSKTSSTEIYKIAHTAIADLAKSVKSKKPLDIEPLFPIAERFIELNKEKDVLFVKAIDKKRLAPWFISHSVNMGIIASKIGFGLKLSDKNLTDLCVAAFVHDVGMLTVPNSIIYKNGRLTTAEYERVKKHPIEGKKLVQHLEKKYPWLIEVVFEEQEREDGSGYPRGLKGDDISLYAKIVGIADIFEAKVHGRSYRQAVNSHMAIQEIIRFKGKEYSLKILKAFIDVVTIYPVGSYVKLNTGEIARVAEVNRQRPIRPNVIILKDARGAALSEPKMLELVNEPLIHIVQPVNEV